MQRKTAGFTLIELMIVVAIVAVIAGIAYPAYNDSVKKSRRSDAISALLQLQLQQEKWRAGNAQYTGTLSDIWSGTQSQNAYYNLVINSANASGFTMTAEPTGDQSGDSCGKYRVTEDGPLTTDSNYADSDCWNM